MAKGGQDARRGRGATLSPDNRYTGQTREAIDDGWGSLEQAGETLVTSLTVDASKTIISYNQSPDVPFDRSINPYKGCEHGCVYCFARPTHAYLDLSPGLDFESRLFYKPDAPVLLQKELAARHYRCAPLMLGINTDAYQPVERKLQLTRQIIEVLNETRHPYSIVTKSALIERDIDPIAEAAAASRASVAISITTLDPALARVMEPRAASPQRRLQTIRSLTQAGIPVAVLVAPLIPVLTDHEMESILEQAREAGAVSAGYVLLRLPHEISDMFADWLHTHMPDKAQHVLNRIRDARGGKAYDARFGTRMRGTGVFAELMTKRFKLAAQRLGFDDHGSLDCSQFAPPGGPQMALF
ncbi:MAG: PA0069 family radical SAM protein [Granulosicoccaceae bacterium]|jgi:DNA repair photolyase